MWFLVLFIGSCAALRLPEGGHTTRIVHPSLTKPPLAVFDPLGLHLSKADEPVNVVGANPAVLALGLAAVAAAQPDAAMAKGGAYGIFEGRIISLAHPAIMAICYAASAWAAFTGFQWRQLRELGYQITDLKAELKGPVSKLAALADEDPTHPEAAALESQVAALKAQIEELTATRKDLASSNLREKHYQVGSVILGLGTAFAIEGPVNTFLRAQKLFPGPHLYAGAGIVVSWAMAASLVPLMAKGKEAARVGHIAFNIFALGLFTWQLPTGWEITQKVIKFTKFP
mmetsp:Transcript_43061/g.71586  ORF Transcript_43061/g.71586 Transcript_43061/m.71586 type:complete len:286 (-) Transcript_43061:426-1283(-)